MTLEELKKLKKEKEEMKVRTEIVFHQIVGQISILNELIAQEEAKLKEIPKEEVKG